MSTELSSTISQPRAIASLASLYILRMLGLFMVLPVLSLSGNDYQGSTLFLLGVALGIYGVTQALLQIPMGFLSDRYGRKPLILIGLLLFAVGSLVAASAETVWGLIIGRALQGAGAIAGVVMAMVADLTTPQNRTKAMASIGASIGLAFALALILGPMIASWHIGEAEGVRLLFWVTVGLSLCGVVILFTFVPRVDGVQYKTNDLSLKQLGNVMTLQSCLLYFGTFVLHSALMVFFLVVPILLEGVGIERDEHSWVYLGIMVLSFIVMVPLMLFAERHSKVKPVFLLAIVLLVLSLLLLLVLNGDLYGLLICLGLFFIAFNYLEANLPSLLSKVLPPENKGAGSGLFASCQFAGAALGGIAGGACYAHWGIFPLFLLTAMLVLIWLAAASHMIVIRRETDQ